MSLGKRKTEWFHALHLCSNQPKKKLPKRRLERNKKEKYMLIALYAWVLYAWVLYIAKCVTTFIVAGNQIHGKKYCAVSNNPYTTGSCTNLPKL